MNRRKALLGVLCLPLVPLFGQQREKRGVPNSHVERYALYRRRVRLTPYQRKRVMGAIRKALKEGANYGCT